MKNRSALYSICRTALRFFFIFILSVNAGSAQDLLQNQKRQDFFTPADSLNKKRFWLVTGTGAAAYTGTLIGLNELWYKQYPRTSFHLFNDFGEWEDMDKVGHMYTAYFYSVWAAKLYRWTGLSQRQAAWTGAGVSTGLQLTLEMLDAYSEEWGFSWGDVGFNSAGSLLFLGQELYWQEQRIVMKYSSWRQAIPDYTLISSDGTTSTTLQARADELYGTSIPEIMVKDYNATTMWLSFNLHAFAKKEDTWLPKWLNVAVGYGAQNLYGGTDNEWEDDEGKVFLVPEDLYPRTRQLYLSLDVDLSRIKTRSKFWNAVLSAANVFKIPAPALELNNQGQFKFHPIFF